jgi:lysozyme
MSIIIDVSHWQGVIDWNKVAKNADPVSGVYFKATDGTTFADPRLIPNSQYAAAAGLKISYYHFARPQHDVVNDANAQADFFITTIKKCPAPTLPIGLDIEVNKLGLTREELLLWIQTFFARITAAGYSDYIIYSYAWFFDGGIPASHNLGSVRLWEASYGTSYRIPIGWKQVYMWQYSAKGHVDGINTIVDVSKYI